MKLFAHAPMQTLSMINEWKNALPLSLSLSLFTAFVVVVGQLTFAFSVKFFIEMHLQPQIEPDCEPDPSKFP